MKKCYVVLAILGIALLLSFPKSTARADFGFPVVFSATVDTTASTLTLSGVNFGGSPIVMLGGAQQLSVQSSTSSQIIASLPANLDPGSYLLTVKFSNPTFTVFEVTIGAVGPPGPGGDGGGGNHLYQAAQTGAPPTLSSGFPGTTLISLAVPAGSYLILGKTELMSSDLVPDSASCFLALSVGSFGFDQTNTSLAPQESAALSFQSSRTFSQPATIYLQCIANQAGVAGISGSNTVLSAVSVGAIN